jgi:membrane-bound acyltransferase YfiQ involved in biofilm formation
MEIIIHSELIWLTSILVGSLCTVIFLGSNRLSSRAFAFSIFLVAVWTATVGVYVSTDNAEIAILFARLSYFFASSIAASFFYFFLVYPDDKNITFISG